jgi:four helix bundle protein
VASEPIRDYRDLIAWQRAIELAVAVNEICDKLPRREWELVTQMRRSATSVHLNIADGNGRDTLPGYLQSLGTSRSELNELESALHYLVRRYGTRTQAHDALKVALGVRRPLLGLIRSLRKKRGES